MQSAATLQAERSTSRASLKYFEGEATKPSTRHLVLPRPVIYTHRLP